MSHVTPSTRRHCLTVDVEEHFQVSSFDSAEHRGRWDGLESRVERNTRAMLDLLAAHQARATFFVLGWVAERYPDLVRAIAAAGHEVASHGYAHEMVTDQTPDAFRRDVRRAKRLLEDITGGAVLGYRAPSFTITKTTLWALPILVEEGYRYDSSIVPIVHDRYGLPGAPAHPHAMATTGGSLWEVPPSTATLCGVTFPVGGGGYLRLYPLPFFLWLLRRVTRSGHPAVLYVHPWELDADQPRMNGSAFSRFRHYRNLDATAPRLRRLLGDFHFGPIREVAPPPIP
jgi:polysaccharide deacetylase family protein (PEP-CTERM system associated)